MTCPDKKSGGVQKRLYASRSNIFLLLILTAVLAVMLLISLLLGPTHVSISEVFSSIFTYDDWNGYVIHDIRLKRSVAAILAGCGLGVAGAAMQCVLKNPLGSPYTLGLSNAAAFGAALGIMVLGGGSVFGGAIASYGIDNPYIVTISAFAFSMVATVAIVLAMRKFGASPETMILAGMAMSAIFSAGIAFLQYMADEMALSAIVFWQFGDLEKISWSNMPIVAFAVILPVMYLFLKRWDLNSMDHGDDIAHSLGVKVTFTRVSVLVISAIMTSVVVSFVGIIGFIGLLAPHLARRLVGDDKTYLLPASGIVGALVLLVAMIVSQNAFSFVIPVGIITSMIGGPLFLWILFSRNKARRSKLSGFLDQEVPE